ncbi:MAG: PDDEXK nuclease domain-containing protein [Clostridia bacterium]|nr:PDDEXK nuclease domain-containing protein [Clostridia bacterium]
MPESNITLNETDLFQRVSAIIENRKNQAQVRVNHEIILMYWEIGKYISSVLLCGERGDYGKRIVVTLSQQLQKKYGSSFEHTNITRMMKFAQRFPNFEVVAPAMSQLTWSHLIALLPLKSENSFMYYANDAASRHLSVRQLRDQIARKAYERQEISNMQLTAESLIPFNLFKDPYILNTLGLRDNYLEADLEKAILGDIESFILEFGHGFTFAGRQKRMTMDGDDFTLDLLFYHRILQRLVAVELKLGKFKPAYMGQMRFYLKWLDRYERNEGENAPIGLILCTEASRAQIELMELDREGIAVSEYWTQLPPKNMLQQKIREIYEEALERLERRKTLPIGQHKVEYFLDRSDDE